LLSISLPAINLAIAEKSKKKYKNEALDILVPCSACYLNLKRTEEVTRQDSKVFEKINQVLAVEGLEFHRTIRVRHLLDVICRDIGPGILGNRLKKPLNGMSIAPYYGCQCLRPYRVFDDPEAPRSMEPILQAAGASIHPWTMGNKCCGASHMTTKPDVGLELVAAILQQAKGADGIVTVCPMCQMNLEAFQKKISRKYKEDLAISILYLPQLLGLAIGLSEKELGLDLNLSVTDSFRKKI
ncbi:MAG: CoB--CoM heterodisulfide reductase iron-sulfur subunit B family protein, partial [Deltaproteobacteria bacterium]|nr:CoB--CoM heterodisulfide reductase iron-sulfur subunit B family protein [Deltaproteobacteria bacterium]